MNREDHGQYTQSRHEVGSSFTVRMCRPTYSVRTPARLAEPGSDDGSPDLPRRLTGREKFRAAIP